MCLSLLFSFFRPDVLIEWNGAAFVAFPYCCVVSCPVCFVVLKKNEGRLFCSSLVRVACLVFLSAADYSPVLPDFVFAVCGFTEAGFAVLVGVEGHRDCGLVLIRAAVVVLAALLRVLKKHL